MIRTLHVSNFIEYLKDCKHPAVRRVVVLSTITIALLFISNNIFSQAIVETFEEAAWSSASLDFTTSMNTGGGTAPCVSFNTTTVVIGATATAQTITTYSNTNSTASVTTTTTGAGVSGTLTWGYSRASTTGGGTGTAAPQQYFHSQYTSIRIASGEGYIISPVITGGVSTITFWIAPAAGGACNLWVGLKTNTTASSLYPTTNGSGGGGTGGLTAMFNQNTSTYTMNLAGNSNMVQCTYTVGAASASNAQIAFASTVAGSDTYIDDIVVTAACIPYTWTGAVDSNWSVAGNWTCGTLPGAANDVIIPAVARLPILSANTTIHSIVLNSGATVGLNAHTFTINGTPTGTGTYTGSSTSSMSFGGSSSGTVYFTTTSAATKTLQNLTLTDGANITIGNALNIASTGIVTVGSATGAILASGGNITLLSDDNGWARVAQVPTNSGASLSTISGSVNVQCYIHSVNNSVSTARRAWRLLTAPVTNNGMGTPTTIYNSWQNGGTFTSGVGTLITAPTSVANPTTNGMDYGINGNYSMYTWTVGSQVLTPTSNTKTANISTTNASAANIGYFIFVRGDRTTNTVNLPWFATVNNTTLSATGNLQLGDQTFTNTSGALSATSGQLSLVGNPYACSINFKKVAGDTTGYTSGLTNIINRIYVWNSNLTGSKGLGGYVCIDDPSNTGLYTKSLGQSGSPSYADLNIQSGQAFFVQTQSTASASITFKENTKTTTNNYVYRPANVEAASLPTTELVTGTLSLLNSDGTTSLTDGIVAQFNNNFCDCVDYIDAPKFTNVDEMFSLARYGHLLCIERRPEIVSTDTLFLDLKQMSQRDYQFGFLMHVLNHPGVGARLEDDYAGTKRPLNMDGTDTVNFTIGADPASRDTGRFKIVFGAVNIAPDYTSIKATQESNTVLVQWAVSNDQQMTGYVLQKSTDGINYVDVYTTAALHATGAYSWLDTNPVAGTNYYRVLSTDVLNEESYSAVVSVTIPVLNPRGITVYPNPIRNGQIGLAFNNMPAGNYRYLLLDEIGQQLQTGSVSHPGGNATDNIPLDKSITNGAYQLEIFSPDNTRTVIGLIY
jgi:hypothetical protein